MKWASENAAVVPLFFFLFFLLCCKLCERGGVRKNSDWFSFWLFRHLSLDFCSASGILYIFSKLSFVPRGNLLWAPVCCFLLCWFVARGRGIVIGLPPASVSRVKQRSLKRLMRCTACRYFVEALKRFLWHCRWALRQHLICALSNRFTKNTDRYHGGKSVYIKTAVSLWFKDRSGVFRHPDNTQFWVGQFDVHFVVGCVGHVCYFVGRLEVGSWRRAG